MATKSVASDEPGKGGRPTKYKRSFCTEAKRLCERGATDKEVADYLEVGLRSIYQWKAKYAEFAHALKIGKEKADDRVERSLYSRAVGFEHDAVKVGFDKDGNPLYAPYREFVVPDVTACIFWLKNRRGWRDKQDVEHSGEVEVKRVVVDL